MDSLSGDDLDLLRKVLDTITTGQELDLQRFGSAGGTLAALETDAELDDYTYRVAGCVGEFWTRMCRAHLFPQAALDLDCLIADGIRFGKGLQLVNILRDLPRDLRMGRCYIPVPRLAPAGLTPVDLLQPENEGAFRPVYGELLDLAEANLAAGWSYTNSIPPGQWRIRLACAWPILLGVRTIELLRTGQILAPAHEIKVSRAEVRTILLRSVLRVPFPGAFRALWHPPVRGIGKAVASSGDLT
jgi:farnesyl-diphosphate farnesyltransferase